MNLIKFNKVKKFTQFVLKTEQHLLLRTCTLKYFPEEEKDDRKKGGGEGVEQKELDFNRGNVCQLVVKVKFRFLSLPEMTRRLTPS